MFIRTQRTGLGFTSYNVVAPSPTGLFAPSTIDLSNSGLEEFQHPEFKGYGPKDSKNICVDISNDIKKAPDAPIIKDWVSDSDADESEEMVLKSDNIQHKPEQANQPRKVSQNPKNNIINWNEISTQKLGVGFQFTKKVCFACGSFSHLIKDCYFHDKKMVQKPVLKNVEKGTVQREVRPVWNNAMRTNHQNFSNSRRNFAPTAVLTKSGIVPISTTRHGSSRAAAPVSAARPLNTAASKPLVNEHDGGYVAFGGGAKGGKITGTGTIRTATKDETSRILKSFITEIENLVKKKVKIIRCDNGTEFKNRVINELCEEKDFKLPVTIWAEAVNTTCYVQNRVLVVKPHFKTPYELFKGRSPALSFMRPFGCHVIRLNTLDQLGKFDGKLDERIFLGYFTISKAFRVYNIRTRKVEENLHITFLKNKPMSACGGPDWLFDIDALSKSINYAPVHAGTNSNDFADNSLFDSSSQASDGHNKDKHGPSQASESDNQERPNAESSTKTVNTVRPVTTATPTYDDYPNDPLMPDFEDAGIFDDAYDDRDEGAEADYNNLKTTLVDLPHGNRAIGTKWVYRSKRDPRGIVVKNKTRLVAQGHRQEEGIDYDEVFAHVARIEAISQPPGFVDLEFPDRVYTVEKDLYGLHQAPRAWYETLSTYLLDNGFGRGAIDKTLFIKHIQDDILLVQVYVDDIIFGSTKRSLSTKFEQLMHKRFQMSSMKKLTFFLGLQVEQQKDGIFLSQDKYVCDILLKFGFSSVKSASTPMETHKPLSKDAGGTNVDVYLYRSMIGSLMYLTSSRPDIMFAVCACSRFQVQPKVSHMHAMKRIFRYLKGQPTLGLWYLKDSHLELIAYSDSDYAGASLDRKSTTGGCQPISWQCKKQTIVANSTTKHNTLLLPTDVDSAICVVKNLVYHSKTKHIEIRHHFIRDSYEKRLIEMVKIHTDYNVADLLTKAFDVTRQTATGKELSNPLMAGSLPKTTLPIQLVLNVVSAVQLLLNAASWFNSFNFHPWTTLKLKTVNDDVRLQALIDGKKVVITEASIKHDLKLNDAEGTSCLPNAVIFEELARMSTMASAIICLANNQKFNFSKYILDNLKKNLEAGVPFYMFPRFIQIFVNHQIGDMSHHKAVEEADDLPTAVQDTPIPDAPSSSQPQRKHKPRRKERKERKETQVSFTELPIEDHVPTTSNDPLPSGEDRMQLKELMVLCTNLSNKVFDLENEVIEMKSSHKAKIAELKNRVEKLEEENKSLTKELKSFDTKVISTAKIIVDEVSTAGGELNAANKEPVSAPPTNITTAQPSEATKTTVDITTTPKAKGIVFHDMEESITRTASSKSQVKDKGKAKLVEKPEVLKSRKAQIAIDEEVARRIKAKWNVDMQDNIDWNEVVEQVQSRQSDVVRKYQALKRKPVSIAQARKNMMIYLKNMAGFKMNFFKGISYEEIRPLSKKENKKKKVEKDQTAKKQKGDNAEKQKLEEQQEAKELKRNLEIVPDDEDGVFVNVAHLSSKPPTIVDYKTYKEGKKEHFQIIRANDNHQMYLAFSTMLKNFDREDLEVLWKIVKDRRQCMETSKGTKKIGQGEELEIV
uniref:Putative ribonuclease H-like domain-containing protein n=1 Tax=Tanacetum cinerariifolium TaxID=118510 RepID=A0A6L2J6E1_TANCI|nr:putative ribonuclease H-like domain-containing protein [Tanacetum cinerariifolium]